eukprot:6865389-Pyramimonas_sp.AAC.1
MATPRACARTRAALALLLLAQLVATMAAEMFPLWEGKRVVIVGPSAEVQSADFSQGRGRTLAG